MRHSKLTILFVLAAAAVAVLIGVALVPHGQSSSRAVEQSSSPAPEWLVALAQKTAANMDESSPESAVYALTTYAKAGRASAARRNTWGAIRTSRSTSSS